MRTVWSARPAPGRIFGIVGVAALAMLGTTARASGLEEYGPRVGFSSDPDQFTVGAFTDWGELAPDVVLRVNSDIGFGDDVLTFTINGDLLYEFPNTNLSFQPYAGGGLGYAFYDFDIPKNAFGLPGDTTIDDTIHEIGLNLVVGFEKDMGGYKSGSVEVRIGIADIPDLKVTAQLGFF